MSSNKPLVKLKKLNTYDCLWPYILKILSEKPSHPYILREEIKRRFSFLPGTVTAYITLYALCLQGFVNKKIQGRRTIYVITKSGREELRKAKKFYKDIYKKL